MKSLSKGIQKSYIMLILIFSISFFGLLHIFGTYMLKSSKGDLITVNTFINYELSEMEDELEEHGTVEKVLIEALEEGPKIRDLYIVFKYQDKIYASDDNYPKDVKLEIMGEAIQNIGFFDYQGINRILDIKNIDPIELIIIKDLKNDKILFFKTTGVALIWISLTVGIGAFVTKRFYTKFNNSFTNICEVTNNINLNSVSANIKSNQDFVEFDNIIHAYRDMLTRLKEQSDAQIDFVNNASHELKTPIFIISGYIDLMKRWGIKEENILKESLESIGAESKNMASLVNKLLFLAKNKEDILELSSMDFTMVINECINNLKILYPNQKIIFNSPPIEIKSDLSLVRQLILNLLENAIKYGKNQPIEIIIQEKQHLLISIKDNGYGISGKDLDHIYDKFYRADKGRDRGSGSHGLGLSIVKKIIDLLKGDIEIKSKEGVGTNVIVTLPYTIQ